MISRSKSYRGTSIHWGRTQSDIMKLLNKYDIQDIQFTTVSAGTTKKSGLVMEEGTIAILLTFQKEEELSSGVHGMVPVRILIPSIEDDDRSMNQAYRLLFWYLKSKFEAIETGLVEFAEEFMPHLQIADKGGVGRLWDRFKGGYYKALGSGQQPDAQMLPPMKEDKDNEELK